MSGSELMRPDSVHLFILTGRDCSDMNCCDTAPAPCPAGTAPAISVFYNVAKDVDIEKG